MTDSPPPAVMVAFVPFTVTNAGDSAVVIRVAGAADKTVVPGGTAHTYPAPKETST